MVNRMMRMAGRNKEGIAKALKVDDQGRMESSFGKTFFTGESEWGVTVQPGETKTILVVNKPIKLSQLTWSTDTESLNIAFYKNGESILGDLYSSGGTSMPLRPVNIINNGSSLFEVNRYKDGDYKFSLRTEFIFPEGVEIRASNTVSASNAKFSLRAFGVMYDD